MAKKPRYTFKSRVLNETMEGFLNEEDPLDGTHELSVVKMAAAALASKIKNIESVEDLSADSIGALTALAKETASVMETIARIDKMTDKMVHVDQLNIVVEEVARLAAKYIPVESHDAFLAEMGQVPIPTSRSQRSAVTQACTAAFPPETREQRAEEINQRAAEHRARKEERRATQLASAEQTIEALGAGDEGLKATDDDVADNPGNGAEGQPTGPEEGQA